jgi:glycosyltransferase involved in cell wall biosynthesis
MAAPEISVIIPVYNGATFLAGAIENVLDQGVGPLQVIVVDDGSTDGTAEIASGYAQRVRYIHQSNAGPSAARNRGIGLAAGGSIAFLDVDDRWPGDSLRVRSDYLDAHPSVEIVQGLIRNMQRVEAEPPGTARFEFTSAPYRYINLGSALFRRSVFERVGLFDERLRDSEDVDWFVRAWENGVRKLVLETVTLHYRKHGENLSLSQDPVNYGLTRLIKNHLDRRRADPQDGGAGFPSITEYLGRPPGT